MKTRVCFKYFVLDCRTLSENWQAKDHAIEKLVPKILPSTHKVTTVS